jgi:hypothetical protein
MRSKQIGVTVEAGTAARLAAVVAPLALRLPRNRRKSALEKRAVYDITFMVFAFYDPVAGVNFTLSEIGNDRRGMCALRGVHKEWPACPKSIHRVFLLPEPLAHKIHFSIRFIKEAY